jgi:hypothetical protein
MFVVKEYNDYSPEMLFTLLHGPWIYVPSKEACRGVSLPLLASPTSKANVRYDVNNLLTKLQKRL